VGANILATEALPASYKAVIVAAVLEIGSGDRAVDAASKGSGRSRRSERRDRPAGGPDKPAIRVVAIVVIADDRAFVVDGSHRRIGRCRRVKCCDRAIGAPHETLESARTRIVPGSRNYAPVVVGKGKGAVHVSRNVESRERAIGCPYKAMIGAIVACVVSGNRAHVIDALDRGVPGTGRVKRPELSVGGAEKPVTSATAILVAPSDHALVVDGGCRGCTGSFRGVERCDRSISGPYKAVKDDGSVQVISCDRALGVYGERIGAGRIRRVEGCKRSIGVAQEPMGSVVGVQLVPGNQACTVDGGGKGTMGVRHIEGRGLGAG
jgi:hypothetical protein